MNRHSTAVVLTLLLTAVAGAAWSQRAVPKQSPAAMSRSSPKDATIYSRYPIPEDALYNRRLPRRPGITFNGLTPTDSDPLLTVVGDGYLVGVGGEPSIAVNPLNPNQIVISSFASFSFTGPAPLYYSQDGGATFTQYNSISHPPGGGGIPDDQTYDYGQDGRLYGALLAFDSTQGGDNVYTGSTTAPDSASAWKWPLKGNGNAQNIDTGGAPFASDQPWLIANADPIGGLGIDRIYTAYDDFNFNPMTLIAHNRVAVSNPGTPPLPFPIDNIIGQFTVGINPGLRMTGDRGNGAVYTIHQFKYGQNGNGSFDVGYVVNRSTDGGNTWSLNGNVNGIEIARHNTNQLDAPKFGTVNALIGGVDHIAANPVTHDVYCVVGHKDVDGSNRLGFIRLHDNGLGALVADAEHYIGITGTGSIQAALPSVAVASNGAVGVLYDTFDGFSMVGAFPIFSAHLAQTYDQGNTWTDQILLTYLSASKDNANARQRVLGDYQQMKTVGRNFYGAFTGNGAALGQAAVMGPIFFKTLANRKPTADAGQPQTLECQGATTLVNLDGSLSSDPDGDSLTYKWTEGATVLATVAKPTVALTVGVHTITLKVTDPFGASDSKTVTITIVDNDPPTVTASANPAELWPPNGKLVPVTVSGQVTDACSGVNVSSGTFTVLDSEGTVQPSGTFTINPDGTYKVTIALQASRDGKNKAGRTYTIQITARDNSGNTGRATAIVTVPHEQGH